MFESDNLITVSCATHSRSPGRGDHTLAPASANKTMDVIFSMCRKLRGHVILGRKAELPYCMFVVFRARCYEDEACHRAVSVESVGSEESRQRCAGGEDVKLQW